MEGGDRVSALNDGANPKHDDTMASHRGREIGREHTDLTLSPDVPNALRTAHDAQLLPGHSHFLLGFGQVEEPNRLGAILVFISGIPVVEQSLWKP